MKAILTLSSLSPEEKNFLKTKQITAQNTPDEWVKFFRKIKDFDKQGDSTRKWGVGFGCLGIILFIAGLFLLSIAIGLLMFPVGLLLVAVGFFFYFYLKPYDIPGEALTKTVLPMILVLREEMKPNDMLKLRLDLRGFSLPEKLLNRTNPYAMGAYHKVIDSFYRDPWMDGDAQLADGSRLIWSVEDFVKSSEKSKRNARGKHKTKTKVKHRSLIQLQIGMNNKKYSFPEKVKQKTAEGLIRTRDADRHSWMSIRKMVKHPPGQKFSAQDFVNTIASAYVRATPTGGKK